ncbi:hypothetical protein ASD24_29700 [Paenibacillus sp. Root52]|uniref:hypothetical protein n=1 Tax=Paenibacillus sp. Root52 TaxID=1736552 RepID=UPI0006FAAEED|nr:hypothetical protein [Paenibacillus sp. Root52]KQY83548.1 hypothetical protein ASD24_29700 [Paenibacillus sp. Root52]
MNLNNYKAISPLPTDLITGQIIAYGQEVVQVLDNSLMLAKEVIDDKLINEAFTLTPGWWKNEVDFDRISFAVTEGQLKWETQSDDIFGQVYAAII